MPAIWLEPVMVGTAPADQIALSPAVTHTTLRTDRLTPGADRGHARAPAERGVTPGE